MARKGSHSPDGVIDIDRGSSSNPKVKQAVFQSKQQTQDRADDRAGYRELDEMIEQTRGMSRASREHHRATPGASTIPLGHPLKARTLPGPDTVRAVMSRRQRAARTTAKLRVQDSLSGAQHQEMRRLLIDQRGRWEQVNDALSDAVGDAQQLDEPLLRAVQRVDRSVQAFESRNDRSHVVAFNAEMPPYVNVANIAGYARNHFRPGQELAFDRYTIGTHCLHELERGAALDQRTIVFELATRRGMYLGRARGDDTAHLLPRGMRTWVLGSHQASYKRPDGSRGTRTVVQLTDTPPPSPPGGAADGPR